MCEILLKHDGASVLRLFGLKYIHLRRATEGTYVVVNLIADDIWGSEDELTGTLSDEVESWD